MKNYFISKPIIMKKILLLLIAFGAVTVFSQAPCPADAGPGFRTACESSLFYSGITLGPASPNPSLTYSWSPSTGLDNPNIANPHAAVSATTLYTLTVSDPSSGCSTAQGQTTVKAVDSNPVVLVDNGHNTHDILISNIDYYYQFETTQHITFTSNYDYGNLWLQNGIPVTGSTANTFVTSFTGSGTSFNYYTLLSEDENHHTCGGFDFTWEVTTYGCNAPSDWPGTITGANCSTQFPVSLAQDNLGTTATYEWVTENSPSNFSFSNFSGNTCDLNLTGCSTVCTDGIYTKARRPAAHLVFPTLTYMYFVTDGLNSSYTGCMKAAPQPVQLAAVDEIENAKVKVFPNPSSSYITISSGKAINAVELYDMRGVLVKRITGMNSYSINTSLLGLAKGLYNCRVFTKGGIQNIKVFKQ